MIPVPILGPMVGSVVGTVGGKLIGGVSGIALSKILEVYEKIKESKINKMSTIPQLMSQISPESDLVRGLMNLTTSRDEEENISNAIEQTINGKSSSIYSNLAEILSTKTRSNDERECQTAKQLTVELFKDSNDVEFFILTPMPDENAAEEFALSTDLLVLRWPKTVVRPWETDGEQVLDIDDFNVNQE